MLGAVSTRFVAQGLPTTRAGDVGLSSAALDRIPAALQRYIDSSKMAGAIVAVARHGTVAAMRLVERVELSLDDPVAKYISGLASAVLYASGPVSATTLRKAETVMTVRDLMRHTSGITYGIFNETPADSVIRGHATFSRVSRSSKRRTARHTFRSRSHLGLSGATATPSTC